MASDADEVARAIATLLLSPTFRALLVDVAAHENDPNIRTRLLVIAERLTQASLASPESGAQHPIVPAKETR